MQYGAMIPNLGAAVDPIEIAALTRQVEAEPGYDTLMVSDHVVLPTSLSSRYPYNSSGIPTFNAEHDILEPFTLLSFLAGITQRVRLGISVQVLPYRHPVLNTKMITTLDVLSQGRIIVGAGVGWMEEEFQATGGDYANRGSVTDEHIQLFKLLCTEEEPVFHGQHYHLEGFKMKPKPIQKPHPPIWVGGTTGPGKRRAAAVAQGWHAVGVSPEGIRKHRADLVGYLAAQGRNIDGLHHLPAHQPRVHQGPAARRTHPLHRHTPADHRRREALPRGRIGPHVGGPSHYRLPGSHGVH